jgi:cell division protein FtsQ
MRRPRFRNAPGILLVIALLGVLGYLLGWSKALEIRHLEIVAAGNEAVVLPILVPQDLHVGLPMARVSNRRITHDLSRFTWIREIKIERRWLAHDVKVKISERKAVAQYLDGQGVIQYFDAGGTHFTSPNPPSGIPTINFVQESADARSSVATFLAQTPQDLTANLLSLSVDIRNQISLRTKVKGYADLSISWGTVTELSLKVQVLRQLLTRPENIKIVSVDISNPLTPVVK